MIAWLNGQWGMLTLELCYYELEMSNDVNIRTTQSYPDMLFITQSRVRQAYWMMLSIMRINQPIGQWNL